MIGKAIQIRGLVQGVGLRPTVSRLAAACQLRGQVWNNSKGVMIHAWGEQAQLQHFLQQLPDAIPPLAHVDAIETSVLHQPCTVTEFQIVASTCDGNMQTQIAADAAVCDACLKEIIDPANRRYRYPFTSCLYCGPRYSIIQAMPYDRGNTSMAGFTLCAECSEEYENPADRRFHHQANACAQCGPQLWLEKSGAGRMPTNDVLAESAHFLRQGKILAIKGIGGFHLACNALDPQAVQRLRHGKSRDGKALAMMARDMAMIERYAEVSPADAKLLQDAAAPIVILQNKDDTLTNSIAPDSATLGFMLPYTPMHHILLEMLDFPLVMTSANFNAEPQCIDNQEARDSLSAIADYFLMHDRGIVNRVDDSVVRVMDGKPRFYRRGRGYIPFFLALPAGFQDQPAVLALGGDLKNTYCFLQQTGAQVSAYTGDLQNAAMQRDFRKQLMKQQTLYDFQPACFAVDKHPDYLSTQWGEQLAKRHRQPLLRIQHHHAHIAACLMEHGLPADMSPVIGIVLDGLGMGEHEQLWGGEFLLADYRQSIRLACFQPVAMPGGRQAIIEPWRNTYAQLYHYFDWESLCRRYSDLEIIRFLNNKPRQVLDRMIQGHINSPITTSCGRWLDAFSAALGIFRGMINYEGQAAIRMEKHASRVFSGEKNQAYAYYLDTGKKPYVMSWQQCWESLFVDMQQGCTVDTMAARVLHGLCRGLADTAEVLCQETNINTLVLSGGVFQNKLLLETLSADLRNRGYQVLSPARLPTNDGGLALGQAGIATCRASLNRH